MSNVSVGRRCADTCATGVADDCHGFLLEQMQHHNTRKRSHSATAAAAMDMSSTSPSYKRCKLDDWLTRLWYAAVTVADVQLKNMSELLVISTNFVCKNVLEIVR